MDKGIMKDKQAFHVVLTTHNSRTSQRMKKFNVQKGPPILLSLVEEIELTRIIGEIIMKNNLHCVAYNICKDHVHLALVCGYGDLSRIVQRIKTESSKFFHRLNISQRLESKVHGKHLWSQKFFRADLDVWQLATLSLKPGMLYKETHLDNTISYVIGNREKHRLPISKELDETILSFLESQDVAFGEEYE